MNMPSEQAFWCLAAICDRYIPGYYSPGMQAIQLDGDILFGLLKRVAPRVHRHLKSQGVEPILYMTEWFLCIFSRTLPWPSVLRVWDMFLCEGVKVREMSLRPCHHSLIIVGSLQSSSGVAEVFITKKSAEEMPQHV